ncbi:hypothetical protein M2322_003181 [Rhodoblastus acidophilus]|uniref:hypothetical protein n=1 Tax=Rhodoblastus acidophilus TaxID=1074 RepID=UPI002225AA80|nr:hypothetical protein [Rhodoblastus acidophilus]MCW2317617.1 hypothetical protein [Rhodoblastus acidophilus]
MSSFSKPLGVVRCQLYLETTGPDGCKTFEIDEREADEFSKNPLKVLSRLWDASSIDEYTQWRASDYSVQCSAIQKNGKQCRYSVAGCNHIGLAKWRYFQGDYCVHHGGETAEVNDQNFQAKFSNT